VDDVFRNVVHVLVRFGVLIVFFNVFGTHVATSLEIEKMSSVFFDVVLFQAMIFEIYLSHFPFCVTYDFFVSMFHS